MALGGKRPGAGRKKGSNAIAADKLREYIVNKVAQEAPKLLAAKLELANGVYLGKKKLETGEIVNVYQEKPDGNSLQYLFNQTIGKPRETVEIQGGLILKIDA